MSKASARLREVRAELMAHGAPATVNLRAYVPDEPLTWLMPDYRIRTAVAVQWLGDAITRIEQGKGADEAQSRPPVLTERDSATPGVHPLETERVARAVAERSVADADASPATDWAVPAHVPGEDLGDWYYGPEEDETARAERASLSAARWEERQRWQAEQQGVAPVPAPDAPEPSAGAPSPAGTPLRQLTAEGIAEARAFLLDLRERPDADRTPPHELLFGKRCSRPFSDEARVERRAFRTRREAGAYLSPRLQPVRHRIADHAGVWSWLGMYYFADIAEALEGRSRDIALEAFVFSDDESTTEKRRSYQRRYRHLLRGAWRLWEQHREDAAFLLDEDITTFNDLADRAFSDFRVFNSAGVVPLAIRLYTEGGRLKPGYPRSPGGLRHLLRVLPQLELTYDVYGMAPDALLRVLPDAFRAWDRAG